MGEQRKEEENGRGEAMREEKKNRGNKKKKSNEMRMRGETSHSATLCEMRFQGDF